MARPAPHNLDAERQVIGCLINWPESLPTVTTSLMPDDFYAPRHRLLYSVIVALDAKGMPVDLIQIVSGLKEHGKLGEAGGASEIVALCDEVSTSANIGYYVNQVKETALARKLVDTMSRLSDICHSGQPFDDIIGSVYRQLEEVTSKHQGGDRALLTLADMAKMYEEHVSNLDENRFKTGFEDLDAVIKGVSPGETLFITAYSGLYKSALLQNLLLGGCERSGLHHLFFSLEMPATRVFERTVQIALGRYTYNVESEFHHHNRDNRADTMLQLAGKNVNKLLVCETPGLGLDKIEHYTRLARTKHGKIGAIGIDYMGLMSAEGTRSEYERISAVAEGSKQLAKRLGVPVIVLTQINRSAAVNGEAEMHSAKGSGAVEASADYMLAMTKDKNTGDVIVKVVKNRNGEAGAKYRASISKPFLRFDSLVPDDSLAETDSNRGKARTRKNYDWNTSEEMPY